MSEEETRVLIAMDGSKYADYAFEWYLQNMHKPKDYVILYHSVEFHTLTFMPIGVGSSEIVTRMIEEDRVHAENYLKHLTEKMKSRNLHGKVKQTVGSPRTEIIRIAEEEHVHVIITGTRGMGTVKRTILGSVSDHLLHHSHVPVLVCRHKDDHNSHQKHGSHELQHDIPL